MTKDEESRGQARFTPDGGRLLVAVIVVSCSAVILYAPQPVAPQETQPLELDPHQVSRILQEDRALAESLRETEATLLIDQVYREAGLAELGEPEDSLAARARNEEMAETIRSLAESDGEDTVLALRARTTDLAMRALKGELSAEERRGLLGTFAMIMERYSVIVDDRLVAPEFVVRTLYKARWNGYMRLELTSGFEDTELRAYWGWLALEAPSIEVRRRFDALEQLRATTAEDFTEAQAALLFLGGDYPQAADLYDALYQQSGNLRYRNHALAAVHAAQ